MVPNWGYENFYLKKHLFLFPFREESHSNMFFYTNFKIPNHKQDSSTNWISPMYSFLYQPS